MTYIEVCEICDIAGCRHIRERQAHQSAPHMVEAPQEVLIGIRGVNTYKADQGDVRYISHDASPEVVATMPGAQAMVAAAYLAAATAIKPVDVYGDGRYFRIHGFHEEGCAYKDDDLILAVSGLTSRILDLTPADAKAALDRLIAEAVAAEFSALQDPLVVHLNMVAGRIAKPLPSQLVHIYGEAEITAAIRGGRT